jgi:hypothetical protein
LPTTIPTRPNAQQRNDRFRDFARAMLLFYGMMACILATLVGAEVSVGAFRGLTLSEAILRMTAVESWPSEPGRPDRLVQQKRGGHPALAAELIRKP